MNIPVSGGQKVKGDEIGQESFCKGFLITLDWKWRPLTQFIIIIIPLNFCKPYDHKAEHHTRSSCILLLLLITLSRRQAKEKAVKDDVIWKLTTKHY